MSAIEPLNVPIEEQCVILCKTILRGLLNDSKEFEGQTCASIAD